MIKIDSTFFVEPSVTEEDIKEIMQQLNKSLHLHYWEEPITETCWKIVEDEAEKEDEEQGSGSIPLGKRLQNMFTKNKSKKRW